ncbi:MAG: RNA polymerase sigma factor [Anaerolineae bacterium]|jgi:RNA polymerase sigma-70 factor (ECF subfamily)
MNEPQLIARAQKGDLDAFNDLVFHYQDMAYNVAYRVLGNEDSASDATQDAFIKAYKALHQYRGGSFKAWLLRIVTNCCYDLLRTAQRRPSTPIDDLVEDDEHSDILENTDDESPEDWVDREELGRLIQRGIAELPPDQRTVLVLSDIEGMPYEEIAAVTSVALGTVKSRLSRARAKLREFLTERQEQLPMGFRPSVE